MIFKEALNPLHSFGESFISNFLAIKNRDQRVRYEQLMTKYRVLLLGFPVAKVTYSGRHNNDRSCLEIIGVSYGTITLLLRGTVSWRQSF